MRNSILYSLAGLVFLLATYACSDNEKYSTSVVRQIEIFLDDELVDGKYRIIQISLYL